MKSPLVLAVIMGGLSLGGCVAGGGYAYYAPVAPPAVRVEAYGAAPGPGFIWINGYWGYRGSSHVWIPGRWERPPRGRSAWAEGRWERQGNRWAYRQGHWR
jgi:hypothetical protein